MRRGKEGRIKDPDEPSANAISVSEAIPKFLRDGGKRLGEIITFVNKGLDNESKYSKMGILKILKKLKDEKLIVHEEGEKYYLANNALNDVKLQGQLFGLQASKILISDMSFNIVHEKRYLSQIMKNMGLYYYYIYLKSFELFSTKQSFDKNNARRLEFVAQAFPIKGIPLALEYHLMNTDLDDPTLENNTINSSNMYALKAKKLLRILKQISPKEMKWLDEIWSELPDSVVKETKYREKIKSKPEKK